MKKKILLLGGTGAMGVYLAPELLSMGYEVDVVSLDNLKSEIPELRYIRTDAMDNSILEKLLQNEYDGIVDFLIYANPSVTFSARMDLLLSHTSHYIYLSSYRVYADKDAVTTESSPRLLDVTEDTEFLSFQTEEYALYKAIGEDILFSSGYKNWTAIRPAITYSKRRFQLVTLEAPLLIPRIREGKTVLLPKNARHVQATMTWAGDVAKMIARILFNKEAYRECYSVCTAEHNTWQEVAEIYHRQCGLKYIWVDDEIYLDMIASRENERARKGAKWQLDYDREFNRVMDNSKILKLTGLMQSDFMTLEKGIQREFLALPEQIEGWNRSGGNVGERMDAYLNKE